MIQVTSQQVQLASLIEACKRRMLLSRHSVVSQVFVLGDGFAIGDEVWHGNAILSPDALFLLKMRRARPEPLQYPGQPSERNLAFCAKPLLTVRYTELPLLIKEDKGWPEPPDLDCEVAVLLREDVHRVRAIPFSTQLEFLSDSPVVRVTCTLAAPQVVVDRLKGSGWLPEGASATEPVVLPPASRKPYLMIAALLALVLATIIAIQMDAMNAQLTLVVCLPMLGLITYMVLRCIGYWPTSEQRETTDGT